MESEFHKSHQVSHSNKTSKPTFLFLCPQLMSKLEYVQTRPLLKAIDIAHNEEPSTLVASPNFAAASANLLLGAGRPQGTWHNASQAAFLRQTNGALQEVVDAR